MSSNRTNGKHVMARNVKTIFKRFVLLSFLALIGLMFVMLYAHRKEDVFIELERPEEYSCMGCSFAASRKTSYAIFTKSLQIMSQNSIWHGRSLILPRGNSGALFTIDDDIAHIRKVLTEGGLDVVSLSKFPMDVYMEDWEWDVLNTPALIVAADAGNGTSSSMVIVNRKSSYRAGDVITVRVDIKDGNGKQKKKGADQVRVWISDVQNQAFQASDVIDLGNGSHISDIPLSWPGDISIKASLKYNVEIQRVHFFLRNVLKTTRSMAAGFESPFGSEATLCSPFPLIPSFQQLCNFTNENGGLPWYCGKPRNSGLDCRHWKYNFDIEFNSPFPITAAEKKWSEWSQLSKHEKIPSIAVQVDLKTESDDQSPKPRCGSLPLEESWLNTAPRGFFMNEIWNPLKCTLPSLSDTALASCLQDKAFLLLGDSNARLMYENLVGRIQCEHTQQSNSHSPYYCFNGTTNTYINWNPHGLPFHVGFRNEFPDRYAFHHAHEYIDEIPSKGDFIVLIHLYYHLTPYHYSVFASRIRTLRKSVEKLLIRNPRTKIIVRGPHAACRYYQWHGVHGSDLVGPHFTNIIKKEFKGLYNKVFFLNPWDMTVAIENVDIHPDEYVNEALMKIVLDFVCSN